MISNEEYGSYSLPARESKEPTEEKRVEGANKDCLWPTNEVEQARLRVRGHGKEYQG